MNSEKIKQSSRATNNDEQLIYEHLISCVQNESTSQLIERFRKLFIDGMGYPEMEIEAALYRIIAFLEKQQDFNYIISRCCYILINRWQIQSKNKEAIADLVNLFKNSSSRFREIATRSRLVNRLRELIYNFTQTEEYKVLQRLASAINPVTNSSNKDPNSSLSQLIGRYPFLYNHCLLPENSSSEQQQTILEIQTQRQRQFEVHLSQYMISLVRQVKSNSKPVQNPTLLTDEQLYRAVKEFVGKVKQSYSYRDLAQDFLSRTIQTPSYRTFKSNLYEYLIDSIDPKYGRHQFNERLYKHLANTLPAKDSQKLDSLLIGQTCSELFDFLVEDPANPNFYFFIDMFSNLGSVRTIGFLLKIILLSSTVKPYLEKRFSILFNYYEFYKPEDISWLIRALENLNVALVVNFGEVDMSYIKYNIN